MKITKDVEISIALMMALKGIKEPVKVASLYEDLNTTEAYLEQIINKLRKKGVIKVKRGPNGGVMRASEDPFSIKTISEAFGRDMAFDPKTKVGVLRSKLIKVLEEETC